MNIDRRTISAVKYLLVHGDRSSDRKEAGLLRSVEKVMKGKVQDFLPSTLDQLIIEASNY